MTLFYEKKNHIKHQKKTFIFFKIEIKKRVLLTSKIMQNVIAHVKIYMHVI
jgi:hypothetical protein